MLRVLLRLIRTIGGVFFDLLVFFRLNLRSGPALAAENLFLRKQLWLYVERKKKPRRATDSARKILCLLAYKTRRMVRVAQTAARFLYVESCNQCPACKHGLRIASHTLDGMFDPQQSHVHSVDLAVFGARSAPQANRCYLPVQGSVLISSLVHKFKSEFDAQLTDPRQSPKPFLVPLIVDFDGVNHLFVYDDKFAFKNPDWTYSSPASVEEPAPVWRHLDLPHEIDELESSEFWKSSDRTAKTLAKQGNLRLVLTLKAWGDPQRT